MIIKLFDELKQTRVSEDYKNYRTVLEIIDNYLYSDIYTVSAIRLTKEIYDKINIILELVNEEITYIEKHVNEFLTNKDYKNLKITSQSHNSLQKVKNRLEDIKNYYGTSKHLPQYKNNK